MAYLPQLLSLSRVLSRLRRVRRSFLYYKTRAEQPRRPLHPAIHNSHTYLMQLLDLARTASTRAVMLPTVLVVMLLYSVGGEARGSPVCVTDGVFPYASLCDAPATYSTSDVFNIRSVYGGRLAPEWDESNSTYYVRLSDDGANYVLSYSTKEVRTYVALNDSVIIVNANTSRVLSWRQQGEQYFLVETDNATAAATFQFSKSSAFIPCRLIVGIQCVAYNILTYGASTGLSPYTDDEYTTYFESGEDLLLFFLLRLSSIKSPQQQKTTLRSVVAT